MSEAYVIAESGRSYSEEFPSRKAAVAVMLDWGREELKRCRARYGTGTMVRRSPNNIEVVIGGRDSSSRWTAMGVVRL